MFIEKLDDTDLVNLINLCNSSLVKYYDKSMVDSVSRETSFIEAGQRWIAFYGQRTPIKNDYESKRAITFQKRGVYSIYAVSDFFLVSYDNERPNRDFSNILREYLTRKFGSEYLDALYEFNVTNALKERNYLEGLTGITR